MNSKILSIKEAIKVSKQLRKLNKLIVIVGGFFDILHLGHIKFLHAAKKYGDYLFVLLEENAKATQEKGKKRPINSQQDRAAILSSLQNVDYVVLLKNMTNDDFYAKLILAIRPNIIASTFGDPNAEHKEKQAKLVNAKMVYVIKRINNHSTTKYVKLM